MKRNNSRFTLIEIMAVVIIVITVVSLVVPNVVSPSKRVVIENAANTIEKSAWLARSFAKANGKITKVTFSRGVVSMPEGCRPSTYPLDSSIEIECEDSEDNEDVVWQFFSDGEASGPQFTITSGGHKRVITLSNLTGRAFINEPKE